MTTNDQPNPDQTGTWEPDQFQMEQHLRRQFAFNHGDSYRIARSVIAEYRRQQAAQGMVEVRRETLQELVNRYSGLRDRYYREARETLAAATEEQQ